MLQDNTFTTKNRENIEFISVFSTLSELVRFVLLVAGLEALSHFTNCVERSFPESLMCSTYRVHTFISGFLFPFIHIILQVYHATNFIRQSDIIEI